MATTSGRRVVLFVVALLAAGCGGGSVDWGAPETFVLRETSDRRDNGVELQYWSLIDASCQGVYDALADVERYPEFITGVDRVQLLEVSGNTKTVQIAQRVIGRQSNAKVAWTFVPEQRRIQFTTLASDLSFNDGTYEMESSPDGTRCLVKSTFLVKEGQGQAQSVPVGVLASGTREAFVSAAQGVKKRAAGGGGPKS